MCIHFQSVIILKKNERVEDIYIYNVMINCSYAAENSSDEIRIDMFARNLFRDSEEFALLNTFWAFTLKFLSRPRGSSSSV